MSWYRLDVQVSFGLKQLSRVERVMDFAQHMFAAGTLRRR